MWKDVKSRAERRGIPFNITVDDIRAVWPEDDRCPVTGVSFETRPGVRRAYRPSLDRLNSEWGYEPGNIAVISMHANRLKSNASAEELEKIARWMRDHGLS